MISDTSLGACCHFKRSKFADMMILNSEQIRYFCLHFRFADISMVVISCRFVFVESLIMFQLLMPLAADGGHSRAL
jgi:hypothetical protein